MTFLTTMHKCHLTHKESLNCSQSRDNISIYVKHEKLMFSIGVDGTTLNNLIQFNTFVPYIYSLEFRSCLHENVSGLEERKNTSYPKQNSWEYIARQSAHHDCERNLFKDWVWLKMCGKHS